MHVYVWEHIVILSYRTALWSVMKLGMSEVRKVPCMLKDIFARSAKGKGGSKIGNGCLFFNSCSDRNTTATNQMHSNDLAACGKKCCYFWIHSEINLYVFMDLVILPYFNAISLDFYAVKCLINIYVVYFP